MPRAAIFDMDGLLIDSEPLWQRAQIAVFANIGVQLQHSDCETTMGLRIDEVVQHWHARFGWQGPTVAEVTAEIVSEVARLVRSEGTPLPGVDHALQACRDRGLALALASSSPERLIAATLQRLNLTETFAVVQSGEHEAYGKPHPAVFLRAAERLGVKPMQCVVFEDSLPGVIAAKAARMACVAVPMAGVANLPKFAIADAVLPSLADLNATVWAKLP